MTSTFLFNTVPPADFLGFLLWGIAGLVGVIAIIWRLYVSQFNKIEKLHEVQIKELKEASNEMIEHLKGIILNKDEKNEQLQKAKDQLIAEIKPTLDASIKIAENTLEFLRNGK